MISTSVITDIPEDIKSNFAKYVVFHDSDYYSVDEFKKSIISSLDKVYFSLIGYELYISKLPKENAEQEYSNICKLYKFYYLILNKMSKIHDNSISDIKEKIKELVSLIKSIQIKVRNTIESDLKNIISAKNNLSLINFLTTEYQNIQ